jgi:hypothetical protein
MISNEYAAEIVANLRSAIARRDETVAETPPDVRDLLLIKLYDDLQALTKSMSFLGGGIRPVTKMEG